MILRGLVISGTGAPPQSELYYTPLINTVKKHVARVDFETIFLLGLGDEHTAARQIGRRLIENSNDQFIIIGHSQGGILASLLAMEYPERVVAVIALASPFKGTTWVDPINMPIRGFVEAVTRVSGGRIRLRPALRRFIVPVLPIVKDLTAHSDTSEKVLRYLEAQVGGHETHAFIGSGDMFVFPHRSANPTGAMVTNYIVVPSDEYQKIKHIVPGDIIPVDTHTGHIAIVVCQPVLTEIARIIQRHAHALTEV